MSGLLISFEGGDGAGKSTLMKNLHEWFLARGKFVLQTRAPGGTPFGEQIRNMLLHGEILDPRSELFLFLADRAYQVKEIIRPALTAGQVVLVDRFNDSTVAYQGSARELNPLFVRSLCLFATENLEPDLTFYLDIDPVVGLSRVAMSSIAKDRIESEALAFHEKIRTAFCDLALENPKRIKKLDAMLSPEVLLKQTIDTLYALDSSYR